MEENNQEGKKRLPRKPRLSSSTKEVASKQRLGSSTKEVAREFIYILDEYERKLDRYTEYCEKALKSVANYIFFASLLSIMIMIVTARLNFFINILGYIFCIVVFYIFIVILMYFILQIRNSIIKFRRSQDILSSFVHAFKRAIQELSSLEDYGKFDDANSSMIKLKLIESEAAYRRARRFSEGRPILYFLLHFLGVTYERRYDSGHFP